jgi:hypothetical protein
MHRPQRGKHVQRRSPRGRIVQRGVVCLVEVNDVVIGAVPARQRQGHALRRICAEAARGTSHAERCEVIVFARDPIGHARSVARRHGQRITVWETAAVAHGDQLEPLLSAAGIARAEVGPEDLQRLWSLVGPEDPQRLDEFLDALAPGDEFDDGLALRAGQWSIDLRTTAVRTGVLTALVAGVLIPNGFGEFVVGFVTAVLPSVVEIERVELGAGDRRLLVELRAKTSLASEDELYAALPAAVRDQINRYDFADFVERLRDAGFASSGPGETIRLKAP